MQTSQIGAISMSAALRDIRDGGCAVWQLPFDPRSPALARSYFAAVATALGLPKELIDDGAVAVSELVTNTHQHAGRTVAYEPLAPPELWIYPRTHPRPQLVVTVFDTCRDRQPEARHADLLDEHGKGLGIVAAVTADTGVHPSRSRVGAWLAPGKAVWFALDLPQGRPGTHCAITQDQAASQLHGLLSARGLKGLLYADRPGVSLVAVEHGPNVWTEPRGFLLRDICGTPIRRPLADRQDVAELIVHQHERNGSTNGDRCPGSAPDGHPKVTESGER
jgi:hypothetical protein